MAEEAEYYARRNDARAYMGEGYHGGGGTTRDWAIVDVPPGTDRVRMDGEEITWQRYNGVRRSRVGRDEDEGGGGMGMAVGMGMEQGRRFVGKKEKRESMWTEITKDLVIREAIEGCGYDFEETEFFYYVMEYLRYVCFSFFLLPLSRFPPPPLPFPFPFPQKTSFFPPTVIDPPFTLSLLGGCPSSGRNFGQVAGRATGSDSAD